MNDLKETRVFQCNFKSGNICHLSIERPQERVRDSIGYKRKRFKRRWDFTPLQNRCRRPETASNSNTDETSTLKTNTMADGWMKAAEEATERQQNGPRKKRKGRNLRAPTAALVSDFTRSSKSVQQSIRAAKRVARPIRLCGPIARCTSASLNYNCRFCIQSER